MKNNLEKRKFCCDIMESYILQENDCTDQSIYYNQATRRYNLRIINSSYGTHEKILYCPWCGTKLPQNLGGVWSKTLKDEFNITDPHVDESHLVPEEFKTDEWWKKRGL